MQIPTVVQQEFDKYCRIAKTIYPDFIKPKLVIQTNGRTAGWAKKQPRGKLPADYTIDLNRSYLISNARSMLEDTLPHEIAHILVWQRYANTACGTGSEARPHGVEWIAMFGALTGRVPSRLHHYGSVKVAQARAQDTMTALAERALKELEG